MRGKEKEEMGKGRKGEDYIGSGRLRSWLLSRVSSIAFDVKAAGALHARRDGW